LTQWATNDFPPEPLRAKHFQHNPSSDYRILLNPGFGTVGYQYDTLGRRTEMIALGQAPVSYRYDAVSRLRTITQAPCPFGKRLLVLGGDAVGGA
jgi:hypothetical protein